MPDYFRFKSFVCDINKVLKKRKLGEGGEVQRYVDGKCLMYTNEKMPKREGILIQSGNEHTKIGSGVLEYRTPYARRLYYHREYDFNEGPERGALAFERMKRQYGKRILDGARKIANGG